MSRPDDRTPPARFAVKTLKAPTAVVRSVRVAKRPAAEAEAEVAPSPPTPRAPHPIADVVFGALVRGATEPYDLEAGAEAALEKALRGTTSVKELREALLGLVEVAHLLERRFRATQAAERVLTVVERSAAGLRKSGIDQAREGARRFARFDGDRRVPVQAANVPGTRLSRIAACPGRA